MDTKNTYIISTGYNNSPGYNTSPPYNSNPGFAHTMPAQQESGWFERNQKNKPQSNSVGAAALVFASGGMNIAWSVGFIEYEPFRVTNHMRICWFIAAIVGALVGAVLCNRLHKKLLYLFSAFLVAIGGILFMSLSDDYDAIVAARYLDGFANGLVLVPTLVMAGEESVKSLRGMISSSIETMCFQMGVFLQIIYASSWRNVDSSFNAGQMHGLLSIVYGILSFLFAMFLMIESPIFYMVRGQEEQAIDALRRLQRPFIVTAETYEQFEEHKRYIASNKELTFAQSAMAGFPALLKLCFYRGLCAMTFSFVLTTAITLSTFFSQGIFAYWPFIVYSSCRWIGTLVAVFMMDSVGRKKPLLFGALCCAGMAIGLGVIFGDIVNIIFQSKMTTAMCLLFVLQLFAGIFITASSTYLSEAFPLAIKPYYIAIAFSVEMVVQLIICVCEFGPNSISDYCYSLGGLILAFFIFGIFCLPETKHTTLREAQNKFRGLVSPRN